MPSVFARCRLLFSSCVATGVARRPRIGRRRLGAGDQSLDCVCRPAGGFRQVLRRVRNTVLRSQNGATPARRRWRFGQRISRRPAAHQHAIQRRLLGQPRNHAASDSLPGAGRFPRKCASSTTSTRTRGAAGAARRQGRRPRRDDPARHPGAGRVHDHDRRLPRLHGRGRERPGRPRRRGRPSTSPRSRSARASASATRATRSSSPSARAPRSRCPG